MYTLENREKLIKRARADMTGTIPATSVSLPGILAVMEHSASLAGHCISIQGVDNPDQAPYAPIQGVPDRGNYSPSWIIMRWLIRRYCRVSENSFRRHTPSQLEW
jgi:hypothetical protein